jgi:hypothetical protein
MTRWRDLMYIIIIINIQHTVARYILFKFIDKDKGKKVNDIYRLM